MDNIRHWYDGLIYEIFIDPFQAQLFKKIKNIIPNGTSLLDIASGTGKFAVMMSDKCSLVTGVDLSLLNINRAVKHLKYYPNIEFIHGNATKLDEFLKRKYDYATISLALHEMPHEIRIPVIEQIKKFSDTIIFSDYVVPMKSDISGLGVRIIEFLAGKSHFTGYKHFQANGGLDYLLKETNLKIVETFRSHSNTLVIYVTKKNE